MAKKTAYETAMEQLDLVGKRMGLSETVIEQLREPERSLKVRFPVRMDDGKVKTFTGYRVQHNSALGPTKGGTRIHPEESYQDVVALSFWMTIKNALAGIPAGGAKGGIVADTLKLSDSELERVCRKYVREIRLVMGTRKDIPGPDIGTPQKIIGWFIDEYEQCLGEHEPGALAGKPPLLGGSLARNKATGTGLVYVLERYLGLQGEKVEGKTVAVQGFGNLGGTAAQILEGKGAKVIGIADVSGAWYNPAGMNVRDGREYAAQNKVLSGWAGGDVISMEEFFALDCDVLIPAAIQSQIRGDNVEQVKAKIVIEGANGPTTPEAEEYLLGHGVVLIPDIVANVGGAVTSYFEMVQDLYMYFWSEAEVLERLQKHMVGVFDGVWQVAQEKGVPLRIAAWMIALDKIVQAMEMRGRF